jgi:hypothetical protein
MIVYVVRAGKKVVKSRPYKMVGFPVKPIFNVHTVINAKDAKTTEIIIEMCATLSEYNETTRRPRHWLNYHFRILFG